MREEPTILIVDDEALARVRLRELLRELHPDFAHVLAGEAANAVQALALIESRSPDIVLLDVQMPGLNGIELARHLIARVKSSIGSGPEEAQAGPRFMPALIFVTAHDDFAVQAFEVQAIDYLLKPVQRHRLLEALQRTRLRSADGQVAALGRLASATQTRRRHLAVNERGRVILVPLEEIIYLKAELKYVTIRTREREYLIEESLAALEEEFSDRFMRIHRNALVARASVAGFERMAGSSPVGATEPHWQVVLREVPERLAISRRQWSIVKGSIH